MEVLLRVLIGSDTEGTPWRYFIIISRNTDERNGEPGMN